jgi:hypothetical protein
MTYAILALSGEFPRPLSPSAALNISTLIVAYGAKGEKERE